MGPNAINYVAAVLFFLTAFRDSFFPGVFQLHAGPGNPLLWFVMGCVCVAAGAKRTLQAKTTTR